MSNRWLTISATVLVMTLGASYYGYHHREAGDDAHRVCSFLHEGMSSREIESQMRSYDCGRHSCFNVFDKRWAMAVFPVVGREQFICYVQYKDDKALGLGIKHVSIFDSTPAGGP